MNNLLIVFLTLYTIQLVFACGFLNNDHIYRNVYRTKRQFFLNLVPAWFIVNVFIWIIKRVKELD